MLTLKERLQDKYQIDANGCWIWTGDKTSQGYGRLSSQSNNVKKKIRAHRVSYEVYNGPIPQGMLVCHSCDIPSCINPEHLWLGTHKDNAADRVAKGRNGSTGGPKGPRGPMERSVSHGTLTQEDVNIIRKKHADGSSYANLSLVYNTSAKYIYRVCARLVWNKE
jgi:hypothetical protein